MSSNCCCCGTIQTSEFGIVERFGDYSRTQAAGCFFVAYPFEEVVSTMSGRICELEIKCETKTKDNVFVMVQANVQYRIKPEKVYEAYYELEDAESQMRAYVYDVIRAKLPTMLLDESFASKDEVSNAIAHELQEVMGNYGYEIMSALINDLMPDPRVRDAMNEINASKRMKEAAYSRAEGEKILKVKKAEAESESQYLSGVGVARQRKAIMDGLKDQIKGFTEGNVASIKDVMDLIVVNQYYDTLQEMGSGEGTRLIFNQSEKSTNPVSHGTLLARAAM